MLVFTIENFASIVLLLYPTLIFTGILEGAAAHIFLYALIVAPICGIVFGGMLFFQYGLIYPERRSVNFIKFSRALKILLRSALPNFKI